MYLYGYYTHPGDPSIFPLRHSGDVVVSSVPTTGQCTVRCPHMEYYMWYVAGMYYGYYSLEIGSYLPHAGVDNPLGTYQVRNGTYIVHMQLFGCPHMTWAGTYVAGKVYKPATPIL